MSIFRGDITRLERYVQDMAQRVGLRDWTITVSPEPAEHGKSATVHMAYGQKVASICFAPNWMHETPEELRNTVLHELLHCHIDRINWPVHNLRDVLGPQLLNITLESMKDWDELAVDGLSRAFDQYMPLPGAKR